MKQIIIVGLGPGALEHLSLGVWETLSAANKIVFRTAKHPVVRELAEKGLRFTTLDHLYEQKETFDQVYEAIARHLIDELEKEPGLKELVYGVPGHPLVGEESVRLLLQAGPARHIKVTVKPGMSFLDPVCLFLDADPAKGLLVLDALDFQKEQLCASCGTVFLQVYSRLVASDLKLALLEIYPPDHPVLVVRAAGIAGLEKAEEVPLYRLDREERFDHLTSLYLKPLTPAGKKAASCLYPLDPLVEIMDRLLSPQGCPWDKKQDHNSLKPYLLEEAYEVIEAIDSKDMNKLKEELGDLLLQVVFHAALAGKRGDFSSNDVIAAVCEKLIRRHPHVFGGVKVRDSEEVLRNWEQIKAGERGEQAPGTKKAKTGIMSGLNAASPALLLAEEVQKKARRVGFDWPDARGAWDKLFEEIDELKKADKDMIEIEDELGDVLFAVVNIARFLNVSPEIALMKTVKKFVRRFNYIEDYLAENGLDWKQMDLAGLDILWEKAKNKGL
ncbi:MAG: nucleoside triphosphate pyrophosphohydrolase [Peptococcaceae bacterium]|nr:nucleoside triphosphate pyrophosphohydrolase [Peptococcaceae bacterium]MDH7526077.1 nucleoside triphosphate pyrophosphohydrolase [Peptococcaceae bacterium]